MDQNTWSKGRTGRFYWANLNGADLMGANFKGADLKGAYRPEGMAGYKINKSGYII